jgi:hypothetical protein
MSDSDSGVKKSKKKSSKKTRASANVPAPKTAKAIISTGDTDEEKTSSDDDDGGMKRDKVCVWGGCELLYFYVCVL